MERLRKRLHAQSVQVHCAFTYAYLCVQLLGGSDDRERRLRFPRYVRYDRLGSGMDYADDLSAGDLVHMVPSSP